jgi:hypothetical protein
LISGPRHGHFPPLTGLTKMIPRGSTSSPRSRE